MYLYYFECMFVSKELLVLQISGITVVLFEIAFTYILWFHNACLNNESPS